MRCWQPPRRAWRRRQTRRLIRTSTATTCPRLAGVLQRIAPAEQGEDLDVPQEAHEAIARLDELSGQEANLAFASWVTGSYPQIIEAWQQTDAAGGLGSPFRDAAAGNAPISDAVEQVGVSTDIDVLDEGVVIYTYSG